MLYSPNYSDRPWARNGILDDYSNIMRVGRCDDCVFIDGLSAVLSKRPHYFIGFTMTFCTQVSGSSVTAYVAVATPLSHPPALTLVSPGLILLPPVLLSTALERAQVLERGKEPACCR